MRFSATGQWQDTSSAAPFPHGVRGIHDITVHVGSGHTAATARRLTTGAIDRGALGMEERIRMALTDHTR